MRIKSKSSPAVEQARAADARRSAGPKKARGKFRFRWRTSALAGAVALGAIPFCGRSVNAASIQQPGWTAGSALGAGLPEGVYFIDIGSMGGNRILDDHEAALGVDIPVLWWTTPWSIAGGKIEVVLANVGVDLGVPAKGAFAPPASGPVVPSWAGRDYLTEYQPAAFVNAAWDFGNGFGATIGIGTWLPVDDELRLFGNDTTALEEVLLLSYKTGNWALSANLFWGETGNSEVPTVFGSGKVLPDFFNYDLGVTYTWGKWWFGPVAFGSNDMSGSLSTTGFAGAHYQEQAQFAAGGLVGYKFTNGVNVEGYLTTDVYTQGYYNVSDTSCGPQGFCSKAYETRGWIRATVPIWNPEQEKPLK